MLQVPQLKDLADIKMSHLWRKENQVAALLSQPDFHQKSKSARSATRL